MHRYCFVAAVGLLAHCLISLNPHAPSAAGGGRVDYVEVVNALTLQPLEIVGQTPTLIAVAAHFGAVRLIDNVDFD